MELPAFTGDEPCAQTDMNAWIAEDSDRSNSRISGIGVLRRICSGCDMREPCLEYALHVKVVGFWGGMTDGERAKERKRRGIQAAHVWKDTA
jgi:hypothetical protein